MKKTLLLLSLLLFSGCSVEHGSSVWVNATVGEASYTPSHMVTGVGPAIGGKGGIAVTCSTIPSSYVVTFYREDGLKQSVDYEDWWKICHIGQKVKLCYTCSRNIWFGNHNNHSDWSWHCDSLRTFLN